jgi:glycosyltransferase involved in cell wall biosynthesis
MKIVVWNGAGYPRPYVTGVGKHVRHMVDGLARRDGWQVRLLIAREHVRSAAADRAGSPLAGLDYCAMPFKRRTAEALWRTAAWPPAETFAGDAAWIYCPRELFIPVQRADYAVTAHDLYLCEPDCPERRLRHRLERRLVLGRAFRRATVVLAVSEFTKGRLVALFGVDPRKVRVVGNGVEEGFFEAYKRDPSAVSPFPGKTYVLSVGGLTRKKGAPALLGLAEAMSVSCPGVVLVICGPVEADFSRAAGLLRNVRVLERGFGDGKMQALVRGAGAVVALSEYEGFGIPVLEAMAAGVPVIAARRAALPEVAGDAAILVEPTHAEEAARALRDVLNDEGGRSRLIARGRRRAREFTWDRSVARLAQALIELRGQPVREAGLVEAA